MSLLEFASSVRYTSADMVCVRCPRGANDANVIIRRVRTDCPCRSKLLCPYGHVRIDCACVKFAGAQHNKVVALTHSACPYPLVCNSTKKQVNLGHTNAHVRIRIAQRHEVYLGLEAVELFCVRKGHWTSRERARHWPLQLHPNTTTQVSATKTGETLNLNCPKNQSRTFYRN